MDPYGPQFTGVLFSQVTVVVSVGSTDVFFTDHDRFKYVVGIDASDIAVYATALPLPVGHCPSYFFFASFSLTFSRIVAFSLSQEKSPLSLSTSPLFSNAVSLSHAGGASPPSSFAHSL